MRRSEVGEVMGWILDVYPSGEDEMTVWIKKEDGEARMFKDRYRPTIYVHGPPDKLEGLKPDLEDSETAEEWGFEQRRVRLRDLEKSEVLRIDCGSMKRLPHFARKLVRLGDYRDYDLYNVDVPHPQAYLHREGLFPLAEVEISGFSTPKFDLRDSAGSTDFDLPPLKGAKLKVKADSGAVPGFEDPIGEISLSLDGDATCIKEGREEGKILRLVRLIKDRDPDILITEGGDSWDLPYLAERAEAHGIADELVLGRENRPLKTGKGEGTSFHSYGRVYYRPPPHYLKGRIHVDADNSFIHRECGMQGLFELARMTRTPLQRTARSSIGSAMTNLQLYWAEENDVLIPWKKSEPEEFKSAKKLIEADRGGRIYDPRLGIHGDVGEIDFGSFYPAMMERYNISPETVLCECCPDSERKVPEIGYNICEKRRGLIPQVLEPVLEKRKKYKRLLESAEDPGSRKDHDERQEALKWVLVTCFGYLGYRNARFGRIEAHEAVTAFARRNLKEASRIAERSGFEVVHGIVDSLWVKKPGVKKSELESLCTRIGEEIGLPISVEGKYRWIVFPPSVESVHIPVVNRYYGAFETGELKARGIAARRSDTPQLIAEAQGEMLEKLAGAEDEEEFRASIPEALEVVEGYAGQIRKKKVKAKDLAVTKKLSREPGTYRADARSAVAAGQLEEAGEDLHAGHQVSYVVTNAEAERPRFRVKPLKLLKRGSKYDGDWYVGRLLAAAEEILGSFGYTEERIKSSLLKRGRQSSLEGGKAHPLP